MTAPVVDPIRSALERAIGTQFRVVRELGRGGMGAVFLARDVALDRDVAIKVLPPEFAAQPVLRERFVREAKLAGSLSHPNIVHVHSVEEHDDAIAIVMQYVDGETLTERVARSGAYDPQDVAKLLQDTAWALGYAHARGIVHRDVKPDNLMIERGTGRAMILDFGIARQERASSLTEVGHSVGTPHYMSPEQAAGEMLDGRSDLYSLGCVGFFAATGRPPFVGESAHKLLMQHLTAPVPTVASVRANFPPGLEAVIARAMAKEAQTRFDTGEALANAVGELALRAREVAPLLRLFYQQTAQSLQSLVMLGVVFAMFWMLSDKASTLLGTIVFILFLTMWITVLVQSADRVRFAVRQGYTAADVEVAFAAIADETARAREQLLADPVEFARIKRRKRIAMFGGMVGGMQFGWLPRIIFENVDGRIIFNPIAGLVLVFVTVVTGISLALWVTRPARVTLAQRVARRVWASRPGRALFARAERRYARELRRAAG